MEIIIPCAGKSTRYPNLAPKYLLKLNDGRYIFEHIAENYLKKNLKVTFILLREHVKKFNSINLIQQSIPSNNLNIFILDKLTNGPADSVFQYVKKISSPIMIQDCDSYFLNKIEPTNKIDVVDIRKYPELSNLTSKSYVHIDKNNLIKDIFEKQVVSNFICCGGYSFESSKLFCDSFLKIRKSHDGEIFISHVIKNILDKYLFKAQEVSDYFDIGTVHEFKKYKYQGRTILIDFDDIFLDANKNFINKNINFFLKLQSNNNIKFILFTTFSKISLKNHTSLLADLGLKNFSFVYDTPYTPKEFYLNYKNNGPENEIYIKSFNTLDE